MARRIDARGRSCPVPILMVQRTIKEIAPGEEIEITADDRAFPQDIQAWCLHSKNALIEVQHLGTTAVARIRRGG
ncbi:MAG: sulfurtransferase TusA family protein [Myxococcales bacterium]|nr:sulfurtransferase TusA family protein [Polyangiaceae bacterium]MDW8248558.1 sulfurtransferase TusA family protein [Myxococcales bacterium]